MEVLTEVWDVFAVHKQMIFHQEDDGKYPMFDLLKPKALKRFTYAVELFQKTGASVSPQEWCVLCSEHQKRLEQ